MTNTATGTRAVNTVLGPVRPDELGLTLMHEHLFVGMDGALLDRRYVPDREAMVAAGIERVGAAKRAGVRTIVDATPIEMGRDPVLLAEVAEKTGVRIIGATGLYATKYGVPFHFRDMSVEDLSALYIAEIEEGIGKTGIRAGVIKVATSGPSMDGVERLVLTAAAEAQKRTGVPIITHTTGGGGDEQAKLLVEAGVDPARIMIGHVDHKDSSIRYLLRILRHGVYMAFDRVGMEDFMPDWMRGGLVVGLFRQGFGDRLMLSMDSHCWWIGPAQARNLTAPPAYSYLLEQFVPRLHSLGLSSDEVGQMLEANPAALFSSRPLNNQRA